MSLRILGAFLIIAGCSACGLLAAGQQRKAMACTEELIGALDTLICHLEFHRTPLPQLCKVVADEKVFLKEYFSILSDEMDSQLRPHAAACAQEAFACIGDLPWEVRQLMKQFGATIGKFDVDGEIRNLEFLRTTAQEKLIAMRQYRKEKGKTNQTLWICAGVAAAVLMM